MAGGCTVCTHDEEEIIEGKVIVGGVGSDEDGMFDVTGFESSMDKSMA